MAKKIIPLKIITIQPSPPPEDSDHPPLYRRGRPIPYHIEVPTGRVARQEFWKGAPLSLVCFLKTRTNNPSFADIQTALPLSKFLRHPKKAIGMYPVFEHENGKWFTYKTTIESISVKT